MQIWRTQTKLVIEVWRRECRGSEDEPKLMNLGDAWRKLHDRERNVSSSSAKVKIQYTRWEIVDFSCKNVILVGYHVWVVGFGRKSLKLEFESKMERQFISALRPEHFSDILD